MDNARHICEIRLSWFSTKEHYLRGGEKKCILRRTSEQQRMLLHNGFKMYDDLSCEARREQDWKCFRRLLVQHIKERERESSVQ